MKILLAVLLFVSAASGETIHITGTRKATDAEKTYKTSFGQNFITGTVGGKRYTLEQLQTWGAYHFEAGKDYEVVKVTDRTIKIQVTDKKGRESTESLNIVGVEEQ